MARKFSRKTGAKYKSRKLVGGKWVYEYDKPKTAKKTISSSKPRIENYYGKYRHKYFNTEKEKKDFLEKNTQAAPASESKIKRTVGRLTKGTSVKFIHGGVEKEGKIIASNGTQSKSPTAFDIEIIDENKNKKILKNIKRENINRLKEAWSEKGWGRIHTEKKREERKKAIMQDVYPEITERAKEIVMKDWKTFARIVSTYYKKRALGGWDASKFGFDEEDLKQEAFIILQNSANGYLRNNLQDKIPFIQYARSFLKANLAAKLAAGSGNGGHIKMSEKDQLYFMFFKMTLDKYRNSNENRYPSDVTLLKLLENERKKLTENKGNKTIKGYVWNMEKLKNKKALYKRTISLNAVLGSESDTQLIDILGENDIENFGHYYKVDPWEEFKKKWIRDSVKSSMKRLFKRKEDSEIMTRYYGLFVEEKSPQEVREYAEGQSLSEIAKGLNDIERAKGSLRRWNSDMVNSRLVQLLDILKKDKDFVRKVYGLEKSQKEKEWSDSQIVIWWLGIYNCISEAIDYFTPVYYGEQDAINETYDNV